MFCEECGYENEPRAKYCIGCGKKIETKPQQITVVKREFPFQPNPLYIFIGIALIVSLYGLPVFLLQNSPNLLTLSAAVSECNSSMCSWVVPVIFYLGWIFGLALIIFGLFQKKTPEKSTP